MCDRVIQTSWIEWHKILCKKVRYTIFSTFMASKLLLVSNFTKSFYTKFYSITHVFVSKGALSIELLAFYYISHEIVTVTCDKNNEKINGWLTRLPVMRVRVLLGYESSNLYPNPSKTHQFTPGFSIPMPFPNTTRWVTKFFSLTFYWNSLILLSILPLNIGVDDAPASAFAMEVYTMSPRPSTAVPISGLIPVPKQLGSTSSGGLETPPAVSDYTMLTIVVANYWSFSNCIWLPIVQYQPHFPMP